MGYKSDFSLSVEGALIPYDQKEFVDSLISISGYHWEDPYFFNDTGLDITLYDAKWYHLANDLKKLSTQYPDLRISCHANGEDGEQIIYDALNGIVDQRDGEMIFPPRTLWT